MANATTSEPALTVKSASRSTTHRPSRPPSPSTPQVADIMTRTVVTATEDTPLPELIDEMVRYGISGIPIVDTEVTTRRHRHRGRPDDQAGVWRDAPPIARRPR